MDTTQSKINAENQNNQKLFCKQPITCPWVTTQPYPSTLNKNRTCDPTAAKSLPNIPLSVETRTVNEKTCPSLQHSSSQFFYFLRLMQLFPETHPATLHTVLCLCKNDFFCAVDKLLYAKRCKALYSRSQGMFKRCSINRSHPYCGYGGTGKVGTYQQEKEKSNEPFVNSNGKEFIDLQKSLDSAKMHTTEDCNLEIGEENNDAASTSTENERPFVSARSSTPSIINENSQKPEDDVTSPGNMIRAANVEAMRCDKVFEAET